MNQQIDERWQAGRPSLGPRNRMRAFIVLATTIGGLFVCYLLAVPFLPALTWALALAVILAPSHRWMELKLRSQGLAAFVSVLWIGLVVMVPVIWLGSLLATEAATGAAAIKDRAASGEWRQAFERNATLAALLPWIDRLELAGAIGKRGILDR